MSVYFNLTRAKSKVSERNLWSFRSILKSPDGTESLVFCVLWILESVKCNSSSVFLIRSYGTLAQRAPYLALHSSVFGPNDLVNYDYIVTNGINSLLIGSRCIRNGTHTNHCWAILAHFKTYQKLAEFKYSMYICVTTDYSIHHGSMHCRVLTRLFNDGAALICTRFAAPIKLWNSTCTTITLWLNANFLH